MKNFTKIVNFDKMYKVGFIIIFFIFLGICAKNELEIKNAEAQSCVSLPEFHDELVDPLVLVAAEGNCGSGAADYGCSAFAVNSVCESRGYQSSNGMGWTCFSGFGNPVQGCMVTIKCFGV
jgi:hypothetical protein